MEIALALTDDQIELLQAFIEDTDRGVVDAYDLIPEEYRQYFKGPQKHGEEFKLAVDESKFSGIEWIGINKRSKHHRYALHGASSGDEILLR